MRVQDTTRETSILFTCFHFDGFHGSVMHVCEIARFLSSKGWKCLCAVAHLTAEMREYALSRGLEVYDVRRCPIETEYDFVWSYHYPILALLLERGLKYKNIHVGCLSDFLALETPPLYYSKCNGCSVVSKSAIRKISADYGIREETLTLFPNLCPDEYFTVRALRRDFRSPLRVLVVSNHIPSEVRELDRIKHEELSITFFGMGEKNYKPVTPDILSRFHVVLSIGKTVMYALGAGIPVYEYDHFGGCGYLSPLNLDSEGEHNFSGRATREKKTTHQIAEELLRDYPKAFDDAQVLRDEAKKRYLLSANVDLLMADVSQRSSRSLTESTEHRLYVRQISFLFGQYLHLCDFKKKLHAITFIYQKLISIKRFLFSFVNNK